MEHPSKPRMNFSMRKKAFVKKVILYVSFVQSPLVIEIRALPQSSQLSKLPRIINHVRRLKFRGGATLRPSIAVKPFFPESIGSFTHKPEAGHLFLSIFGSINDNIHCCADGIIGVLIGFHIKATFMAP